MRLSYNSIDPIGNALAESETADLKKLTEFLEDDYSGNLIVIDCIASQELANCYTPSGWPRGIHVVATNKKAGSGPDELYDQAKQAALSSQTQWLYGETTAPGSGLPLLATLKDPVLDVVKTVSGRFSGSVLFIFSQLRQGASLSKALAAACEKGLCEPDPRDDLNNVDNARFLVVLGCDLGLELELSDVECDSLLPSSRTGRPRATSPPSSSSAKGPRAVRRQHRRAESVTAMLADDLVPVQLSMVDVATGKAGPSPNPDPNPSPNQNPNPNPDPNQASVKAWTSVPKDDPVPRIALCRGGEVIVEISSQWSCRGPAPASRSRPRASSPTCSASRARSSP